MKKRSRSGVRVLALVVLLGLIAEGTGPFAYGQSAEYVSIRVVLEKAQAETPVELLQQGTVLTQKETNGSGSADFFNLSQGRYVVEVPEEDFRKPVEVDSRLTEVVVVPSASSPRTGAGGGTTVVTRGKQVYLYGVLVALLIVVCGLAYLFYRRTGGVGLRSLAGAGGSVRSGTESHQSRRDGSQAAANSDESQGVFSGEVSSESSFTEDDQVQDSGSRSPQTGEAGLGRKGAAQDAKSEIADASEYRTESKIGAGGMSTVWRARDRAGRDVALKVMSENMLDDEDLVRKFIQEGKALDRINSTHPEAPVVQVYDYGYLNGKGRPYLALEYLEGDSLEEVIDPGFSLRAEQALPIIKQIAIALSAAHANGVYHRDIKPENVIIVGRSSILKVRLIDFGVARHDYLSYVTLDGSLMGTPPYMSPEQGTGGEIDERSDIYALGALSYALLAGEPPFVDENPLTVLEMHKEASVPPLPSQVPSAVADLVRWMLQKDPEERPSQMWQVVGRIDELIVRTPNSTGS